MAANEGLKPVDQTSQVPIDPNVRVPDHVRRAAEAAEAIHHQAYTPPVDPAAADAAAAEATRAEAARLASEGNSPPLQPTAPTANEGDFTGQADPKAMQDSEWARRYNSMHGRWQASERSRAAMEVQMTELGQELVRTQNMLQTRPAPQASQAAPVHNNLITEEDRASYGDDLLDVMRRTAQATVAPELEALRGENARLTQRVQNTGRRELFATLDQSLPNWRVINQDTRFKAWLRLPNIYTGDLRGNMLKAAVDGAQAPKVLALFKDFLAEATATGQMASAAPAEQHQAPHTPALDLETLAAPGRARPASGDSQLPADKKIYSRADISKFYDEKRRGLWANRLPDAQAFENDLTAAQREGRIRG